MDSLRRWRSAGIIAATISGFLLHDVFSWTGSSRIIGLFVPVNESVWEHLKLGYWSIVLFSIAEYPTIRKKVNNYFLAKAIGVVALELTIVVIFYSCNLITGKNFILLDISSYIIGVVICQYLTYSLLRRRPFPRALNSLGIAACIILGVSFGIATYQPPHIHLFRDGNTHTYGINKDI